MERLSIDEMGPRGRAVHEFARMVADSFDADADLGPKQKLHAAFTHGFEVALALHRMDPDLARDAFEQRDAWQERKWGADTANAARERQKLIQDTTVIRNLARKYGDA